MIKRPIVRYIALLLWMGLIFWLSATPDLRTVPLAQRFGFLPRVLGPEAIDLLEIILRKSAHMIAYGILAAMAYWSVSGSHPQAARNQRLALAMLITVAYAISDEYHQSFVPTRVGTPRDVMIDAVGALISLSLIWQGGRRSGLTQQ